MGKGPGNDINRNYGIDLLRMVSMYMIVVLHVLGRGGAMTRVIGREGGYYAAWFLETCAYCAVDCYGLISGYVGVKSRWRLSRLLELWFQVFFYSAGITLVCFLAAPELLPEGIWPKALIPVCARTYWYFSAYTGLFLVMPFLNRLVKGMQEQEAGRMARILFLLFSAGTAVPKAFGYDPLQLVGGYSFMWLCVLYLLGACIRCCPHGTWKKRSYVLAYFGMVIFSWLFKIVVENYTRGVFGEARYGRMFTTYTAPTILLCAVCLLFVFEKLELGKSRMRPLIRLGSPLAFSVYLIHTHPVIWENMLKGAFSGYCYFRIPWLVLAVVLTAAGIYLCCSLLDAVRSTLFRMIQTKRWAKGIAGLLENRIYGQNNG